MKVGEHCTRNVVTTSRDQGILESAKLMRKHHVGSLVVVSEHPDGERPVGILTDRDLVMEVLALEVPLESVSVGDIMTASPVIASEDEDLFTTMETMRAKGIRRLPVTDEVGRIVGILTTDDLLVGIYEQLGNMVSLIAHEQMQEFRNRGD